MRHHCIRLFFGLLLLSCQTAWASHQYNTIAKLPAHGGSWRIALYQGGEYVDYLETLRATIQGLVDLGWIQSIGFDLASTRDVGETWRLLSSKTVSPYLTFVGDAIYSAEWSESRRREIRKGLLHRLNTDKDIDLVIAMGTWAGQDLANREHSVDTLVMSVSDAVAAGVVKGTEHSGLPHVHAHVDPTRDERQIRIFHQIIKFKKLGMIYEDSVNGRSYAALGKVNTLQQVLGFEIISCHAPSDIPDDSLLERRYQACLDQLIPKVDALYVTLHGGVTDASIPQIVSKTLEHFIPTFSQSGSAEVQRGMLFSISRESFRRVGRFQAAVMAEVLNGAHPGDIGQVFEEATNLAINLKTAEKIGLLVAADLIAAADVLYLTIPE